MSSAERDDVNRRIAEVAQRREREHQNQKAMTTPGVPTIHLNGSSARTLIDEYREAYGAIRDAIDKVRLTAPHMRNYYVQRDGDASYKVALDAHIERLRRLQACLEEYEALVAAIYEQRPNLD